MDLHEDDREITRLFFVRRTLMQMLNDRKYIVEDSEIDMTKDQFMEKYGQYEDIRTKLEMLKAKRNDSSDKIYVFFPSQVVSSSKKKQEDSAKRMISECVQGIKSENVFRAILVIENKLSSQALTFIFELCAELKKFHLEVFQESELLVNITEQVFVPKHQVLTDDEKKALLERYTVKETQLPQIKVTDPIAKYYGLKRGQVVKIIRYSETEGHYVTYRVAF